MRAKRNAVAPRVRVRVAYAIARRLFDTRLVRSGQRIAVYAAFDGEIDLAPFIRRALRAGCAIYAPRIVDRRARRMDFVELPRHPSRFARTLNLPTTIAQPKSNLHRRIDPRMLDVVLVPLLAFDMHGWRLGFGGGFYDRKFAFVRRGFRRKPLLVGVAYEFQCVPEQTPAPWDVLLDAVITDRHIHWRRTMQS